MNRINIAFVLPSLANGGAERQVLELVRHLDHERFLCHVVLLADIGAERARSCGAECFVMRVPPGGYSRLWRGPFGLAAAILRTRDQLVRWRIDVVHAFLPAPSILGNTAAKLARIPVIVSSRRSLAAHYRGNAWVLKLADRFAMRLADLILGNSEAVCCDILCDGCPPKKVGTIRNGVDLARFSPRRGLWSRTEMGWSDAEVVFGMIANFRSCKRHVDFVRAAALIARRHPEARFLMVGADHGSRAEVGQLLRELGLSDRVRCLGSIPDPETVLPSLDVCVSTSETEGFSNVLLEAMACACPVIATRAGGNSEAVADGETGFLVPVHEPSAVAAAAERLLADPVLRNQMGRNARRRAEQQFSLQQMVRNHEQLYVRLLSEKSAALTHGRVAETGNLVS